jgi:hypothetical protein
MRWLLQLWRGQYSLPVAFWGFYFVGSAFVVLLAAVVAAHFLYFGARTLPLLLLSSSWGYWVLASVGVWRSASTGKSHFIFEVLAKLFILVMVARFIWFAATGGLQRVMAMISSALG